MRIVTQTNITCCPLHSRGKVRDIYDLDENTLLIVTTDRMSAFDVIMGEPIPYKGVILNQITMFWMDMFRDIIPNHLVESDVNRFPQQLAPWADELEGRAVMVRKAAAQPVECIVRGYLSGSGWKDYKATGRLCDYDLPAGLRESDKLEPAIFTPSTKAILGQHDENISRDDAAKLLGADMARQLEDVALRLYNAGSRHAAGRGIIVADTKFEFGLIDGCLHLIDEVLTPDSSRFWPADRYVPGQSQPSYDKQFLRDWLARQSWNMQPPAPALPQEIIDATAARYREAYETLTGKTLAI